jgi:hypothetical protein
MDASPHTLHPASALWLLPVLAAAPAHAKVTVGLAIPASKLKPGDVHVFEAKVTGADKNVACDWKDRVPIRTFQGFG